MNAKKKQELISDLRILKDINMKPNYAELARKYDMDYRTVKKYFENGGQIPKRKNREQFSRWDPYAEKIQQLLQQNGSTIRGIHEYFRETLSSDQLPGTYSSLKAYIQKKGFTKDRGRFKETHPHYETDPGQQVQADWIEGLKLTLKSGETVKPEFPRFFYQQYLSKSNLRSKLRFK